MMTIVEYLQKTTAKSKIGRDVSFFNNVFNAVFMLGVKDIHEERDSEKPVVFHYRGNEFRTTYDGFTRWVNNHLQKS